MGRRSPVCRCVGFLWGRKHPARSWNVAVEAPIAAGQQGRCRSRRGHAGEPQTRETASSAHPSQKCKTSCCPGEFSSALRCVIQYKQRWWGPGCYFSPGHKASQEGGRFSSLHDGKKEQLLLFVASHCKNCSIWKQVAMTVIPKLPYHHVCANKIVVLIIQNKLPWERSAKQGTEQQISWPANLLSSSSILIHTTLCFLKTIQKKTAIKGLCITFSGGPKDGMSS